MSIQLRTANERDIPFIFSSWLKSYRTSRFGKGVTSTIFFTEHHRVIEMLLKKSTVIVACNADDMEQVYGWICADKIDGIFCLHYVYVKHDFRKLGIAETLLKSFEHDFNTMGIYSHHTPVMDKWENKYTLIHHPYVLFPFYNQEKDNGTKE